MSVKGYGTFHRALDLALEEDTCVLFCHLDTMTEETLDKLINAVQYLDMWAQEVAECKEAFSNSGSGETAAGRPVPKKARHIADSPQELYEWVDSVLAMLATSEGRQRAEALDEYVSIPTLVRKARDKLSDLLDFATDRTIPPEWVGDTQPMAEAWLSTPVDEKPEITRTVRRMSD